MISAYFTDEITWIQAGTQDAWGDAVDPVETTVKCRVNWKTKLVQNQAGEQVTSSGFVEMSEMPSHRDQLRISGVEHAIIAVAEVKSFEISHYEVYLA